MRGGGREIVAPAFSERSLNQYLAFGLLWLAWAISWGIAAFWADRAENRPPLRDEILYRVLLVASALLIFWPAGRARFGLLWFTPPPLGWTLLVVAVFGIAFAWWARVSLGRLWSGNVTRKADHHVVDTGPYSLVRHPIYTGLLLALYATAIDHGTVMALVGAVVATVSIVIKAQLEERLYSFGAEVESNTIEAHVARLRKKIGADMIETVRGMGYKLGAPGRAA